MLPAILPLLILNYNYSYFAAGLLVTAYQLTSSVTQPVIGWLSDTKGFFVHVSISLLIGAVFIGLIGIAHNYFIVMVFAILAALGHATFHPTALSIVSRLCNSENRARITSYFVVGGNLGFAVGPILAGIVVWWLGLPGLLLLIFPAMFMALTLKFVLSDTISKAYTERKKVEVSKIPDSINPFLILLSSSIFRAWAIYAVIAFLPTYLVTQGYDLVVASAIATLMLLAGVVGQIFGGYLSDRYGKKEFILLGQILTIPPFYVFFLTSGVVSIIALILFGFALWSTFSVPIAMSHELLPQNVGLASGLMLGLAIGIGGLGVAVNGIIADHYSLAVALSTIPIPIIISLFLMIVLPYPLKSLKRFSLSNFER
ncbi:MAG: MFS transporter [Methanoregulaceae archaeon]